MIHLGGRNNAVSEFCILMKLITLLKMCLNETYCRVPRGKHLSDAVPIYYCLQEEDAMSQLLFNFPLKYDIRKVQAHQKGL